MRVWTIQPWSVCLQLKKHGVDYADDNLSHWLHSREYLLEDDFTKAYHWMESR